MDCEFIDQGFEIVAWPDDPVGMVARAARTCYLSEPTSEGADERLVRGLIRNGHHAMLEFAGPIQVRITCDRGISHELVRHRLFSFAQESQRWVNYGDRPMRFVLPQGLGEDERRGMELTCTMAAASYRKLVGEGLKPELARYVLPNATATQIVVSGNAREWRHFFMLRTAKDAHPEMQRLAKSMLAEFKGRMPVLFDDIDG